MSDPGRAVRVSIVAARCFLRGLPLFVRAAPRTPLRALGIIAFDTLHVLRTSQPLPRRRISDLALFLDFQGCANAAWDQKDLCRGEYQAIQERLQEASLGTWIEEYLDRLRALESRRPATGGDRRRFDEVRSYREASAQLALAAASGIARTGASLEEEISAIRRDADMDALVRILLQCQVVDDVLDYRDDLAAGLPTFLTACASLPEALELTASAVGMYAASQEGSRVRAAFPFRVALWIFTAGTRLIVRAAQFRHRADRASQKMLTGR